MSLTGPDISAGHPLPNLTGQAFLFDRACLGTTPDTAFDAHQNYSTHLVELRNWPDVVRGSYIFLAGPKRGQPIPLQMGKYAELSAVGMTCLDWETDSYTDRHTGKTVSFGRQPFAAVLQSVDEARLHGMDPGVYCSRFLLTLTVVKALVKKKVAFIWGAAYDGLTLPDFVLNCGLPIFHQYTGTGLDRSRFFGAAGDGRLLIDQLRALAGQAPVPTPGGDVKFIQLSAADADALDSIALPANTPIEDFAGTEWTHLGPTNVRVLPGLVDAHSNRRAVVISTGRFYEDGVQRPTAQVAVLGG